MAMGNIAPAAVESAKAAGEAAFVAGRRHTEG
jgi:hypothetical protein